MNDKLDRILKKWSLPFLGYYNCSVMNPGGHWPIEAPLIGSAIHPAADMNGAMTEQHVSALPLRVTLG